MAESERRWPAVLGVVLVGLWTVGVSFGGAAGEWLVEQASILFESRPSAWLAPVLAIGATLLAGLPALGLLPYVQRPWIRATLRFWALAAGCAAVLGLTRFVPYGHDIAARNTFALGSTVALAALLAVALILLRRFRPRCLIAAVWCRLLWRPRWVASHCCRGWPSAHSGRRGRRCSRCWPPPRWPRCSRCCRGRPHIRWCWASGTRRWPPPRPPAG
ncbi:hypothetical protein [Fodinicola feengrottensis]|uniref:hypothetical protein n=1 Tax=Fodinicola feengrottensis TaxID=435914 RepID=UPI00244355B4|nr:hypothetical protein [Fodinicola feengrottensis]